MGIILSRLSFPNLSSGIIHILAGAPTGSRSSWNLRFEFWLKFALKIFETLVGMVEVKSTITPKLQVDNKRTVSKKRNPSSAFQCPKGQMQENPWHWVILLLLRGENSRGLAALRASRSSSPQWTPPALMTTKVLREMTLTLDYQLRAKAREKEHGRHQMVSTADIQAVGLTFEEDSKKYVRWGVFRARDSVVRLRKQEEQES